MIDLQASLAGAIRDAVELGHKARTPEELELAKRAGETMVGAIVDMILEEAANWDALIGPDIGLFAGEGGAPEGTLQ
jgi:hypothetical protein